MINIKQLAAALLLGATTGAAAQDSAQPYEPTHELPDSMEIVMVFASTSTCIGNSQDLLDDAIRKGKVRLSEVAESEGSAFYAIGAALEWSVEDGLAYLMEGASNSGIKEFGAWDEVQAGRNWLNAAAVDFIWRDSAGKAVVPQVVVFRRPVKVHPRNIEVEEREVVVRAIGAEAIIDWFEAGSPLSGGSWAP